MIKNGFFKPSPVKRATVLGGAKVEVEERGQNSLSNITRVYNPPSVVNYDTSDPRYEGKSDQVENIYLPAQDQVPVRSGFQQLLNWLTTGRMA